MSALSYNDTIIILQVKNWQTADKYAVCFSRLHGKIAFIAYGAKYPRSLTGRLIQPFAVLNAEFYEGSSVEKLKSCEVVQMPETFTIEQMAYGSLAAEVTGMLTETKDAKEEIGTKDKPVIQNVIAHIEHLRCLCGDCQHGGRAGG